MIGGDGDVEVLAYVNSNLIVIHNDHVKAEKSSSSLSSVPSSSSSSSMLEPSPGPASNVEVMTKTLIPQNLSEPSHKGIKIHRYMLNFVNYY